MTDMKQIYEQIVIGAMITSANQPSIYSGFSSTNMPQTGSLAISYLIYRKTHV